MKFNKLIFLAVLILVLLSINGFGQNYNQKFNELSRQKGAEDDTRKLLQDWEKFSPDDPELYVAYANFYIEKSRSQVLNLGSDPNGKESVKMTKTDNPQTTAYLSEQTIYEPKSFALAISYLDKGIEKFPNRLDMRFGKTYVLGENLNYQAFTEEIIKTVNYSNVNKNQWLWMDNKSIENPEKFMLNSIQEYIVQLFDAGDNYFDNIKSIAETILKYYPDSIENLSNLAITMIIKKDFDSALEPLLKAEKIAPKDFIVLNNIAWCYFNKKDKPNAIKYYNLVIKYGYEEAKVEARERIKELEKLR